MTLGTFFPTNNIWGTDVSPGKNKIQNMKFKQTIHLLTNRTDINVFIVKRKGKDIKNLIKNVLVCVGDTCVCARV